MSKEANLHISHFISTATIIINHDVGFGAGAQREPSAQVSRFQLHCELIFVWEIIVIRWETFRKPMAM